MHSLLIGAWLALLGLLSGAAGAAEPLAAERFFKPAAVRDIALSPSGRRLALSAESPQGGRVALYVLDLDTSGFEPRQAALFKDADVVDFRWADEERLLFGATDLRAGAAEDQVAGSGLYGARFDGSDFRQLIERRQRAAFTDTKTVRMLSWNHELLATPLPTEGGARPGEVLVGEWIWEDRQLLRVVPKWLDTRSGRERGFDAAPPTAHVRRWWFDAQGRAVLALSRVGQREQLFAHEPDAAEPAARWRLLGEGENGYLPFQPVWTGAGLQRMLVERSDGPGKEGVLARFDAAQRKPGPAWISVPGFDVDAEFVQDVQDGRLLGLRLHADTERSIWLDPKHVEMQKMVDEALPGRVNRMDCRRCGAADARLLVRSYSDRNPGQLLIWDRTADGKGRWQLVAQVRPGLDPAQMASKDLERIRARDGRELPVWVTRPAGAPPGQKLPTVVMVHGGPWVRGGFWGWDALPQFLASRGYLVIEPEFRGSSGYGDAHMEAGFKQWGQTMQDDVADALLWARQQGLASDAACIVGGSYGGYSALMGLVRQPELYRCASAWVAVTDLPLYVEGAWWLEDNISPAARRHGIPLTVGDAAKDREMLLANSPVAQVARIKAPVQLVWGSEDRRVPLVHGKRLRDALQAQGREPEWIVYEGEAHGFRKRENEIDFAQRLERFLARYLR